MFAPNRARTRLNGFFEITGLIFEGTAREIRKNSRNPILAILSEVMRVLVFVAVFYVMFAVLGNRTAPLRGDFVIFLVSGIFLFFAHTRAVSAVLGAEGPTSAMMQHAPMNSIISIGSSALSVLYSQAMAAGIILLGYHVFTGNVVIDKTGRRRAHVRAGLVFRSRDRDDAYGGQTMVSRPDLDHLQALSAVEYDRQRQDVCRKYPAGMDGKRVRLESALSCH